MAGRLSRLMLVTDRTQVDPGARTVDAEIRALTRHLDDAIEAGLDIIQVRERDLDAARLRDLARSLVTLAAGRTAIVVNDRADVARVAGAQGVHLRGDGPPASRVRPILSADQHIGRSVHLGDDLSAGHAGDWAVFGPVFPTSSKPGVGPAGLDQLSQACAGPVPVFAIGGVTVERARACRAAGASGVAGIGLFLPSAVSRHPAGLRGVVSDLRAALESGPG